MHILGTDRERSPKRPPAGTENLGDPAASQKFFQLPATIRPTRALIPVSDVNTWQLGGGTMHREGPQLLRTVLVPGLLMALVAVIELAKATV